MSICINIPFYNPEPFKKEGFRGLTRYDYLMENILNLKEFSIKTDIFVHTHNNFLDDKNNYFRIVRHKINDQSLKQGYLTWNTRKYIENFKNDYDYFIYLEHDIKLTEKNFLYWKKNNKLFKSQNYNPGFLIYEKNQIDNKKKSIHITKKFNKFLRFQDNFYIINDLENYCCFWIYDKEDLNKFVKTNFWNFKNKVSNYRHHYGITERAAIGWNAFDSKKYCATLIPLNTKFNIDEDCLVEHITNNYFDKFDNKKKSFTDIRGVCKYNIDELVENKKSKVIYSKIPFYFSLIKIIVWNFRLLRLIKKIF